VAVNMEERKMKIAVIILAAIVAVLGGALLVFAGTLRAVARESNECHDMGMECFQDRKVWVNRSNVCEAALAELQSHEGCR